MSVNPVGTSECRHVGAILVLSGTPGLGIAIRLIPWPVVIGFTNGIGALIASTQLRDRFALPGLR